MNWRRLLPNLFKVLISAGALAWVLSSIPLNEIVDAVEDADLWYLLVAYVLFALSLVVRAGRWLILLRGLGSPVSFWRLVELYYVGSFFNSFLPSGFGGDVVRAAEVTQDVDTGTAVGTVLVDRLTGLMVLFVMALAVLPFSAGSLPPEIVWPTAAISLVGLAASLVLLQGGFFMWLCRILERWLPAKLAAIISPTGDGSVARIHRAVTGCGWRAIMGALATSGIFNSMLIGVWFLCGKALGLVVSAVAYITFIPILSLVLMVPSIGGLGVREGIAPLLFGGVGVSDSQAIALSLVIWVLNRGTGIVGGLVYLVSSAEECEMKAATLRQFGPLALLLLFFLLALGSASGDSPTMDEQNHIARGLVFLKTGDSRLSVEHPPLVNGISALFLLSEPVTLPTDDWSWEAAEWYRFADQLLWHRGNDVERVVFLARLPIIMLALLLGALLFRVTREWAGAAAGLLALGLFALDPNILAHAHYATTDLGSAFVFLAFVALWRAEQIEYRTDPLSLQVLLSALL